MRYKDIADVRNRGRRESFGPRKRIKINDLIINRMTGEPMPSTEARKAQRPMSERWLFTITRASHPVARLWREFFGPARINVKFPGWKSFKKRANAEGNAKIARAMAR